MANTDPTLRFLIGAAAAGVLLVVLAALSPVLVPSGLLEDQESRLMDRLIKGRSDEG